MIGPGSDKNDFKWNKGLILSVLLLTVILKHPVCMYLCIVTKQCKDPSTKRKGKRQRWHSGLRVDKVVSDTLLRQPLYLSFFLHKYNLWYLWQIWALHWGTGGHPEKCLFSDVDIDQYPYIHELPPTPQCLRIPFFIFENIQNYNQVSISRPFCIYR